MKSGRVKRSLLFGILAVIVFLSSAASVMADVTVQLKPSPMYIGETCEVVVKPNNRKFTVLANFDPEECGFELVKKKYIKSVNDKTYNGKIRIELSRTGWRYRTLSILEPFFVATLPEGQVKAAGRDLYSFRVDAEMIMEFQCNAQKPIKWTASNKKVLGITEIDKTTVRLSALQEGMSMLTANYMGHKYTVMIRVLPKKTFLQRLFG